MNSILVLIGLLTIQVCEILAKSQLKKCSKSKCSRCLCFIFLWIFLIIGDFFFFFDGYYILEHVHSGPIHTIFHSHISRFIEQLASIITPFSFRKNLWFIQCIVVVRHAAAAAANGATCADQRLLTYQFPRAISAYRKQLI